MSNRPPPPGVPGKVGVPPIVPIRESHNLNPPPPKPTQDPEIVFKAETSQLKEKKRSAKASQESLNRLNNPDYWSLEAQIQSVNVETRKVGIKRRKTLRDLGRLNQNDDAFDEWLNNEMHQIKIHESLEREAVDRKITIERNFLMQAANAKKALSTHEFDNSTKAFVDLLMLQFDISLKGRKSSDQKRFKIELCDYYGMINPLSDSEKAEMGFEEKKREYRNRQVWCPVLRKWSTYQARAAAHIAPYRLGQTVMDLLFRKDEDNTSYSVRNGLLLNKEIEEMFDEGMIAFVPSSDDPHNTNLKIRVFARDKNWLSSKIEGGDGLILGQLHNRELVFLNENRPARRYLYFMYCVALHKAHKYGGGRVAALEEELRTSKRIWATPGKYMRETMLRAFALSIGHDISSILHIDEHAAPDKIDPEAEVKRYRKGLDDIENE